METQKEYNDLNEFEKLAFNSIENILFRLNNKKSLKNVLMVLSEKYLNTTQKGGLKNGTNQETL